MAVRSGGQGDHLGMHVEAEDFRRVALAARDFDKKLYGRLRRAIRSAGDEVVADVRAQIGQIPASGKSSRGLRAALQKGTKVSLGTGGKTGRNAGIRITTSARGFPAGAVNTPSFRHPVFASPKRTRKEWAWVAQQGRPYFGSVIAAHAQTMRDRVREAIDETAREMAAEVEH